MSRIIKTDINTRTTAEQLADLPRRQLSNVETNEPSAEITVCPSSDKFDGSTIKFCDISKLDDRSYSILAVGRIPARTSGIIKGIISKLVPSVIGNVSYKITEVDHLLASWTVSVKNKTGIEQSVTVVSPK